MKRSNAKDNKFFREAIKSAGAAARRKAFRKGLPVAISKKGKIILVYKDKTEIEIFPENK